MRSFGSERMCNTSNVPAISGPAATPCTSVQQSTATTVRTRSPLTDSRLGMAFSPTFLIPRKDGRFDGYQTSAPSTRLSSAKCNSEAVLFDLAVIASLEKGAEARSTTLEQASKNCFLQWSQNRRGFLAVFNIIVAYFHQR